MILPSNGWRVRDSTVVPQGVKHRPRVTHATNRSIIPPDCYNLNELTDIIENLLMFIHVDDYVKTHRSTMKTLGLGWGLIKIV